METAKSCLIYLHRQIASYIHACIYKTVAL
nr:MAG TPA: hypothetical protein [Caudoviricetes sp.]